MVKRKNAYNIKYKELVAFIREHCTECYIGTNESLDRELDWFLANKRLFIIRGNGRLIAICAFMVIKSPEELITGEWPKEDAEGKYLFVRLLGIHSAARDRGIMSYIGLKLLDWFNNLEYLIYRRNSKHGKLKIRNMEKFIHKEVSNGWRRTGNAPSSFSR